MFPEGFSAWERLAQHLVDLAPMVTSLALLLVAGFLLSWVARRVVSLAVRRTGLETLAERVGLVRVLYALQVRAGLTDVLSRLASLVVWLSVAMSAADVVGLPGVAEGFAAVVEFLPKLVTATVIAAAGLVAADVGRRVVDGIVERRGDLVAPKLLGSVAYYVVVAVFASTAVQQVGIETAILDTLLVVAVALSLGTLGLSLALGSRRVVDNTVARHYASQLAHPGDVVTVGAVRGVVVRYDALTVSIRDAQAVEHVLPCTQLLEGGFTVERTGGS